MSDLKVDGVIASTGTNTNLTLQGKGSGKVAIGDGALLFPDADGSANQVIETNASGVLSFVTPSAGGAVLIQTVTPSGSATADFENTAIFDGTYNKVWWDFEIDPDTDGGDHLLLLVSIASSYVTSGYSYHLDGSSDYDASYTGYYSRSASAIRMATNCGGASDEATMGTLFTCSDLSGTVKDKLFHWMISFHDDNTDRGGLGQGYGTHYTSAAALDGIRFKYAGNMTGTIKCYGLV